jgi:bla regulator protein BlaR1
MNALVSNIGWTLVNFLWQGALIGLATALALAALRRARPEQRYLVACCALLASIAWPTIDFVQRLHGGADADLAGVFKAPLLAGSGNADGVPVIALLQDKLRWIVGFWAACAAVLALRMALGLAWVRKAAKAPPADARWQAMLDRLAAGAGFPRAVRVRVVDGLASPVTAGWWRPVVLLPASLLSGMPADLIEALLAHEVGHIRRYDYLVNLGQNLIEIVLFYHPAVWWMSARIRAERELIADDFAAQVLGEPRRLALALSELEKLQFSTQHLALAANGGDLMSRITRLLRPDQPALHWKAALPVLALTAACLTLAACATTEKAAEKAAETPVVTHNPVHTQARADFTSCAKPVWPKESLRAERTGTVTLRFTIDADGKATESSVTRSSGDPLLDEAARTGIAQCSFKPATEDGKPVQAKMQMQYVWTLN